MLRPGDIVVVSLNPTVKLAEFQYAKPQVSLQRRLGVDPKADVREMQSELVDLYWKALFQELLLLNGVYERIGKCESVQEIMAILQQEQAHAVQEITLQIVAEGAGGSAKVKPKPARAPAKSPV
jgi:hypothetical protein